MFLEMALVQQQLQHYLKLETLLRIQFQILDDQMLDQEEVEDEVEGWDYLCHFHQG
jgi:hypothetical protein